MASNRGVVYMGPGVVEIQSIDFPKLALGHQEMRARSDPEGCRDQHLRQRPAYGARPHHRALGARPGPRDYRRGHGSRTAMWSSSRLATCLDAV